MSRLLFAAARGARIQYYWYGRWMTTSVARLEAVERAYRIHPVDQHLVYGPISSALRECATTDFQPSEYIMGALAIASYKHPRWSYMWETELHRSLYLLFLAESLADEGL